MSETGLLSVDYTGQQGGLMAQAFAAGAISAFTFLSIIGRFIWGIVGKAKDSEIERLKIECEADRERCSQMETRLVQHIQQLEGFILAMSSGHMRQEIQAAISEHKAGDSANEH